VIDNPPPLRDYATYGASPPTYVQFNQDPVYCVCHGSQYDPMLLVVNTNDKNGAKYVGAQRVHGPAPRALPVIPVQAQGQNLVGGMADPNWYIYC
jgi:Rieske Fe-S protein